MKSDRCAGCRKRTINCGYTENSPGKRNELGSSFLYSANLAARRMRERSTQRRISDTSSVASFIGAENKYFEAGTFETMVAILQWKWTLDSHFFYLFEMSQYGP